MPARYNHIGMPTVERPDGVELSWRTTGEGPLVVFADNIFSVPEALEALERDLARDHTVLIFDPRGVGRSTRRGPYDLATDAADMLAVVEAAGGGAVAVGPANGGVVSVLAATDRPDLIGGVVSPTGVPLDTAQLGEGGLSGSAGVLKTIGTQLASDYRGAVRSVTTLGNPQATEEEHRLRVEAALDYRPQEAAMGRWEAYFRFDADADMTEASRGLGDRLAIMLYPGMPWWPVEMADSLRELLPEAVIEVVEDGPVSRPDLAAGVVRRMSSRLR